jgi:hypothetical protein
MMISPVSTPAFVNASDSVDLPFGLGSEVFGSGGCP